MSGRRREPPVVDYRYRYEPVQEHVLQLARAAPVSVASAGEFDEMLMVSMEVDDGDVAIVTMDEAEALALMRQISRWWQSRRPA